MSGAAVPLRRLLDALGDAKAVLVDEFRLSPEIDPMMLTLRSLESALGEFYDTECSRSEKEEAEAFFIAEARAAGRQPEPARAGAAPVVVRFTRDPFVVVRPAPVRL